MEEAMSNKRAELASQKEKRPEEKKRSASDAKRTDKNERFLRSFTPLNKQPFDLLEVVMRKPGVQIPAGHRHPPRNPPSDKFCKFHNYFGHLTNDCRNLKIVIEKLIQEGELLEYVKRESGQYKKRKEADDKTPGIEGTPEPKGIIKMIYGGPTIGDSNRSRKASARELYMHERHEVWKVEKGLPMPEISLGPDDNPGVIHPHDDALVVTVELERYKVQRVFVDTGAAVNIIFESCFNQLSPQRPLNSVATALHGFAGDPVMSFGSIDLMLTLGEGSARVSKPITFLVVRQESSYNIIL